MAFTSVPNLEIFGNILNHTEIGGVAYLLGFILVILTTLIISNDKQHMKTTIFPVAITWHMIGVNQHLLLLIVTALLYVTNIFSMKILGDVITSAKETAQRTFNTENWKLGTERRAIRQERKALRYDIRKADGTLDLQLQKAQKQGLSDLVLMRGTTTTRRAKQLLASKEGISIQEATRRLRYNSKLKDRMENLALKEATREAELQSQIRDENQKLRLFKSTKQQRREKQLLTQKDKLANMYQGEATQFAISKLQADQAYRKGLISKQFRNRIVKKAGKGQTANLEGMAILGTTTYNKQGNTRITNDSVKHFAIPSKNRQFKRNVKFKTARTPTANYGTGFKENKIVVGNIPSIDELAEMHSKKYPKLPLQKSYDWAKKEFKRILKRNRK